MPHRALKALTLLVAAALPLQVVADTMPIPGNPSIWQGMQAHSGAIAGQWQLVAMTTDRAAPYDAATLAPVTLQISIFGEVSGTNGCNRIMFQLDPLIGRPGSMGWFSHDVASTRMLCHGLRAAVERELMAVLRDAAHFVLSEDMQVLEAREGPSSMRLRFQRLS